MLGCHLEDIFWRLPTSRVQRGVISKKHFFPLLIFSHWIDWKGNKKLESLDTKTKDKRIMTISSEGLHYIAKLSQSSSKAELALFSANPTTPTPTFECFSQLQLT